MRTTRIRIGFAVIQMPFHHPVRLAVQLALLDNFSKGRIDVGIGKALSTTNMNSSGMVCAATTAASAWPRRSSAGTRLARNTLGVRGQILQSSRPGTAAQAGATTGTAALAQRHLARLVHRMRPPGIPILTARLPVERIKERWALYEAGLAQGGHDAATRAHCWRRPRCGATFMSRSPMPRRKTIFDAAAAHPRAYDACASRVQSGRFPHRPGHAQPMDRSRCWRYRSAGVLLATGSLFGSPARVREQVAALRDVGVRHLLCQTGFGDMSHEQNCCRCAGSASK